MPISATKCSAAARSLENASPASFLRGAASVSGATSNRMSETMAPSFRNWVVNPASPRRSPPTSVMS